MFKHKRILFFLFIYCLFIGSSHAQCRDRRKDFFDTAELKLIKNFYLDKRMLPQNFGGISGIDYDSERNKLFMVSDDKSEFGPPRYYSADLDLVTDNLPLTKIDQINVELSQNTTSDFESIRYDSKRDILFISNEGEHVKSQHTSITLHSLDGELIGKLSTPNELNYDLKGKSGPRANKAIEGISLSCDGQSLLYALEGPLIEDDELPTHERGAITKIYKQKINDISHEVYKYPIDPIPLKATGGKFRSDNGISEILEISNDVLLVVERSGNETKDSYFKFDVRVYIATPNSTGTLQKKLLINFSDLNLPWVDNIESVSFGPRAPDGSESLIFFSDDNFSAYQLNQLIWMKLN